ncbi:dihydrolipoamide dehydrogenase [Hyphomicrobium methylovorum]|uniref:dihydrolipoyl dehydrogenase family protein n=1 Tax=Hyphomicrobium methylovorum TaxID=84 RepID=UPI0015E6926D|nr:FAD-dependent oxidoreductase [Hyphomicrobium methylovorum]MBA2126288.1 dihydrolipoamide dehydrogenase [Hyphomicrobium methylovorum]
MPKDTPIKDANGAETIDTDFCIIGAGAGGLTLALMLAAFGQRVVVVEKHKMGGESLNYGTIPSKALLAAAKRAHAMRTASPFGVRGVEPIVDHALVQQHIRQVVTRASLNAAPERFAGLGVRIITAPARFVDKSTVAAGDARISARRFVIATGSSQLVPPIPGLSDVAYLTSASIFTNTAPIPHLIVIGAGATGLEIAQAYARLGSHVTVLDSTQALAGEDPELSAVLLTRLAGEGIAIHEGVRILRISGERGNITVELEGQDGPFRISGSDIFLATGRKPNVANLGLEAAGIRTDARGIQVDAGLRTRNRRVYAIGDVTGGPQNAHVADEQANVIMRRALFRLPAKTLGKSAPRVVFTDPELATVGLSETDAHARYGKVNVLRWPYHEIDRAQAERETDGHLKVITTKRGKILGAAIVGAGAGEIIQMWSLAISKGLNIRAMVEWTAPTPTFTEINKRAAFRYFATAPSSPFVRKIISWLSKLG